jgi:hypothetical protein
MAVMEEKLGTNPRTGHPSCCGLSREPSFSGVVDLFKSVDNYVKGRFVLTV